MRVGGRHYAAMRHIAVDLTSKRQTFSIVRRAKCFMKKSVNVCDNIIAAEDLGSFFYQTWKNIC